MKTPQRPRELANRHQLIEGGRETLARLTSLAFSAGFPAFLAARKCQRSFSRLYLFEASLQAVLPCADFIANQATLTADQLSFRLDARVPANEIWLEIRSSSDPESDDG